MNTTIQQQFDGNMNVINAFFIASVVVLCSIVIAEQNIPLDLNLDIDAGNAKNILAREDWREPRGEDNNWRKKSVVTDTNNNWNATSIYQNDNQLAPILSDDIKPGGVLDSRQAAPTFKLRF